MRRFYWGRIPQTLEAHGATIFFGSQDGWGSLEDNGRTLLDDLNKICGDTGCEKVNIIGHSKGGIEARYLCSVLGAAPRIASITTICTPHRGERYMEKLAAHNRFLLRIAAPFVDLFARLCGDKKPDFLSSCTELTCTAMSAFNARATDVPGVFYQSFAAVMKGPLSDPIMGLQFLINRRLAGANDGLVSSTSALYWPRSSLWESPGPKGISHSDATDYRRRTFGVAGQSPKAGTVSDILDTYIGFVSDLKNRGF